MPIDHALLPSVTINIDDRDVVVPAGINVAAALLEESENCCFCVSKPENPADAEPRGTFCLMGVCFDCLVEINGRQNVQACLTVVEDGMRIRRCPSSNPMGNPHIHRKRGGNG
jgi:predicted molibdopterin-dependent oxidoreductase YjgC